jgi:hypothetical protein
VRNPCGQTQQLTSVQYSRPSAISRSTVCSRYDAVLILVTMQSANVIVDPFSKLRHCISSTRLFSALADSKQCHCLDCISKNRVGSKESRPTEKRRRRRPRANNLSHLMLQVQCSIEQRLVIVDVPLKSAHAIQLRARLTILQ